MTEGKPRRRDKLDEWIHAHFTEEELQELPAKIIFPVIGVIYIVCLYFLTQVLPLYFGALYVSFMAVIMHVLFILVTSSFYRVHYTSSDVIPKTFYEVKEEEKTPERYCDVCKRYKGYRVHHCEATKKCVYKLDHFCTVLGNSLGYHNFRYFFLFLFYLWVSVLFVVFNIYEIFYSADLTNAPYIVLVVVALFFGNMALSVSVELFAVGVVISTNLTFVELVKYLGEPLKQRKLVENTFSRGFINNWREVMQVPEGKWLISGFLPTQPIFDKKSD
uniref:Palmitoyltransferase n=1 Tax=Entamoeba invadens TaxID=33085 RepID=S0B6P9_ENTIV|nr:palmitoyltransferase PFA3, putative [Entamoeba invadens]